MKYVFDIETDGFLNQATKVHCIVLKNSDTNEIIKLKKEFKVNFLIRNDKLKKNEVNVEYLVDYN